MSDTHSHDHTHDEKECKGTLARMSEYIDRELDAEKLKALEAHFTGCPPCLVVLKTLRKTVEIFAKRGNEKIPPEKAAELHARLKECIEKESRAQ